MPAYYCHETLTSITSHVGSSLEMRVFDDGPLASHCAPPANELAAGDVILVVNYFGLFSSSRFAGRVPDGVEVVEDHTHDPWSPWAREEHRSVRVRIPAKDSSHSRRWRSVVATA